MNRFVRALLSALVGTGLVALPASSASAAPTAQALAYPNCIFNMDWLLTHSADGDPIFVGLPGGGAGAHNTVCQLLKGAINDAVFDMQWALQACHGYVLAVDGNFGQVTKNKLMAFQTAKGLTVDGIYGPQTGKALKWPSFYGETSLHHTPGTSAGCRAAPSLIS